MSIDYIRRLTVPGTFSCEAAFAASLLAICVVFLADVLTPVDIRLHVLYIFPLASMAIHCERLSLIASGILISIALQLFTFYDHGIPTGALATDLSVAGAAMTLTVFLARNARTNYLAMERLAKRDSLTGLLNRRGFESQAKAEIARQARYGGVVSLVIIDLDHFKQLNDSKGHLAGDLALKLVSTVLAESTREVDIVARLGGDEFAILMPHTGEDSRTSICASLADDIDKRMTVAGFSTTASIGFVSFERVPESVSHALQFADKAMYQAKAENKARRLARN